MSATKMPAAEKPKRRRRTSESARREILDAAGRQLMNEGPDGLRLQAIAADLAISHSSILHHFGSRDGLLDALSLDAFQSLERDLLQSFEEPVAEDPAIDLFDQISRILGERGHARLLAWQLLSGRDPTEATGNELAEAGGEDPVGSRLGDGAEPATGLLDRLARAVHRQRIERARSLGRPTPDPELDETRRLVVWTACTVFAEAFVGDLMMHSAGLGRDPISRKQFRDAVARAIEVQFFPQTSAETESAGEPDA